jgi:GTP-binding protein HflX
MEDSLDEMAELADTAGIDVLGRWIQRRPTPDPRYLMGKGKLQELVIASLQEGADLLIFDQELTPAQVRSIGDFTELRILDRTQCILDIFAQQAQSRDGKLQVELAKLRYALPRLRMRDDMLSRLTGGIGARGPGETKMEVSRRLIQDRIHRLEQQIKNLSKERHQRRALRRRQGIPVVAIVGYTNAGKSTLLNSLTRSAVRVEDRLFATLDPASRRLRFPQEREIILTDTVGFIRDLPADLLNAFRATLEELAEASLLVHLVDISRPQFESRIEAVERILGELDIAGIPRLLVFNKADLWGPRSDELATRFGAIPIAATDPATLPPVSLAIERVLWSSRRSDSGPTGDQPRSERTSRALP